MDGIWIKHCPVCGQYMRKEDPAETGRCPVCGWREYVAPRYCAFRHRFCVEDGEEIPVLDPERRG